MKLTISILLLIFNLAIQGCSKEEQENQLAIPSFFETQGCISPLSDNYNPNATENDGSCQPTDCSKCDFFVTISNKSFGFDGEELGVKPGDIICLDGAIKYDRPVSFTNIRGTEDNPVLITNCNGKAVIDLPGRSYAMGANNSKYFRISGAGDPDVKYGISLSGVSAKGLDINNLSSNFEIDNIEVYDIGFAGIMAKTDPTCDDATIRGNYTMEDVSFHHNYVHDVGGEGFYIGNSFYENGRELSCGTRLPHDIVNVKVYSNIIRNSGWESIQVGCAIQGAEIFNNDIENFGVDDRAVQNNGIQIGEGTGGLCYNNRVVNGSGTGIIVLGYGDNVLFNNIIIGAKKNGIYCDTRFSPGKGFKFINNTIINPGLDGINVNAQGLENKIFNNLIVNPGNYNAYQADNTSKDGDDAFVNFGGETEASNNLFELDITKVGFVDPKVNFDLRPQSPAINNGMDVSMYNVIFDMAGRKRPAGEAYDIGAYEFQ